MTRSLNPALSNLFKFGAIIGSLSLALAACNHASSPVAKAPAPAPPAAAAPNSEAPPGPPPKPDAVTTDVVVVRNDTLDRIFRKLNLNLTDLANLRAQPGIKTHLDPVRMGESLHFVYRDDELDGFERRLNEDETLKVERKDDGLHAEVLQSRFKGSTSCFLG